MELKKLNELQEELINQNINYFDQIKDNKTLESALHESIKSMNKEMITYFLNRGVEVKILHLNHIMKASDNLNYIKFLETKGIDIHNDTSRLILDAVSYARDKTTIYILPKYKDHKNALKLCINVAVGYLNSEKKANKIEGFQNIIANILSYVSPEIREDYLGRINDKNNKSIVLSKYLELKMKDMPEPTTKVKANKI